MNLSAHPLLEQLEHRQLLASNEVETTPIVFTAGYPPIDETCKTAVALESWINSFFNFATALGADVTAGLIALTVFKAAPTDDRLMCVQAATVFPLSAMTAAAFQMATIVVSSAIASAVGSPNTPCEDQSGLQGYFMQTGAYSAAVADVIALLTLAYPLGKALIEKMQTKPALQR